MIAFATAEDALNALCGNDVDPLDSGATYTDAARDRVLSELTALTRLDHHTDAAAKEVGR